ncbi:hypothetical protein I2I11_14240 [Pontibacter sp. 172403-2]|uniref:hypothetical protein n=1 Tax=Pontibacter rufus TaxID=2791028 RepID=UPI0018AFA3E6|nr:hypothetical protein [Pontibacter sp. 172403-2]MBF9254460.1 hypothetical protein [Pontibacter sp. 172403-2]
MTRQVNQKLNSFESQVSSGEIVSFTVSLYQTGLKIKAADKEAVQEVPLLEEILIPLKVFFAGVDTIEYSSFDYVSLKSFLSAQNTHE